MAGSPSPFFTNPAWGNGFTNLASAFVQDPGERDRAALYRAQTDKTKAETGEIHRRGDGADGLATQLGTGDISSAGQAALLAAGARGGDPRVLGQLGELARAFVFSQNPSMQAGDNAARGAGASYGQTQGGTQYVTGVESGDRRRGQDVSAGATLGSARIHAGATLSAEQMRQAGADRRMAPEINSGNVVFVPTNSPLASRADANGRLQGNASLGVEQGQAARSLRTDPAMPAPEVEANRRVLPGAAGAEIRAESPNGGAQRPPIEIGGKDMEAIDLAIGANLPSGYGVDPAAAQGLRTQIAEEWQRSRNLPGAAAKVIAAYMAQNPPRTDNRNNPFSAATYGAVQPQGAAPTGGARAATGAPTSPGPAQRPQFKENDTVRQNGKTYRIIGGKAVEVPSS